MYESGAYSGPANKGCGIIIEEKRLQKVFEKNLVKHYIFVNGETLVKPGFQLKKRSVLRTNCK